MHRPITRRLLLAAGAVLAGATLLSQMPATIAAPTATADFGFPPPDRTGRYVKHATFPVSGKVAWIDSYGACRDGCARHHEGQDLFGKKGQKLVAAVDGTIVVLRHRSSGNTLYIRSDADGWYYGYLHINDDAPGTDNGRNTYSQAFAPKIGLGSHVRRGQHIAYLGDSGSAESTTPHCHFEIRKPAWSVWHSQAVNAKYSLTAEKTRSRTGAHSVHRSTAVPVPSGVPPVRRGDSGGGVSALQRALNGGTGSRLSRDGQFGPATETAVKHLQQWSRLTPDGVYGPKSQWVLRVAL